MRTLQNQDRIEMDDLRDTLEGIREEATRIAEHTKSLRDMVELITLMFQTGPVDENKIIPLKKDI